MNRSLKTRSLAVLLCFLLVLSSVPLSYAEDFSLRSQPRDTYAYEGDKVTVSLDVTGQGLTYQWFVAGRDSDRFTLSKDTDGTYSITMTEKVDGRQLYCIITDESGQRIRTNTFSLHMAQPLKITRQPESVTAKEGAKASVTVEATGDELTYQWYYANKGSTKFSKASITGPTYALNITEERDGRQLYCVITDAVGSSVQTDTVTLTMQTPIRITRQPEDVYAYEADQAAAHVEATGEGLTYQWYIAAKGSDDFSLSSVTRSSYGPAMSKKSDGRRAYCLITDQYGETAKTDIITFRMATKLAITKQPENAHAKEGEKISVTVEATGDELTYQWYYANKGSTKFSKASITGPTYTLNITEERDGRQIYCVITDAMGSSVQTDTVTLTMQTPIRITRQPEDVYTYEGDQAAAHVEATGDGLTYQWYIAAKGSDDFSLSSVTRSSYGPAMSAKSDGRRAYCLITDQYGETAKTDIITFRMATKLEITRQPENAVAKEGEKISVTVEATGDELVYQWYYANKGSTKFAKASITGPTYALNITEERDGRQLYCVITDAMGSSVQTNTVTLTMIETLKITHQPENFYGYDGDKVKVTVEAKGGEGLVYEWYIASATGTRFSKSSVTGNTYGATLTDKSDGRQLYCIITNVLGETVQTDTVTLNLVDTPEEKVCYLVDTLITPEMTDYDTTLALYNWVCANVTYDYGFMESDQTISLSPLGAHGEAALMDGTAVCQGFGEAFEWLMLEAGLPADYVSGEANGGAHGWVIAQLDGEWYQFDPTWDESKNNEKHNYFGLSSFAISHDHEQITNTHTLCNGWKNNYNYKSGQYDAVIEYLQKQISAQIKKGIYTGQVDVSSVKVPNTFWYRPDHDMVCTIVTALGSWPVNGRVELSAEQPCFTFTFYPDEQPLEQMALLGVTEGYAAEGYEDSKNYFLYEGYSERPVIETVPANLPLTFESDHPDVVSVDKTGLITAHQAGTAWVTIRCQNQQMRLRILVNNDDFWLKDSIAQGITMDESFEIGFECRRRTFADCTGTWTVDDPGIAVIENGVLKPLAYGKTSIRGTLGNETQVRELYVRIPVREVIPLQTVITGKVGETIYPSFVLEGCNQDAYLNDFGYFWLNSDNEEVARSTRYYIPDQQDDEGRWIYSRIVECIGPGTCTMTVKLADHSEVTCQITVTVTE